VVFYFVLFIISILYVYIYTQKFLFKNKLFYSG
jgi:hypothetical protein